MSDFNIDEAYESLKMYGRMRAENKRLKAELKRKEEAIEKAIDDIDDRRYGAARWTLCKATEEASDDDKR